MVMPMSDEVDALKAEVESASNELQGLQSEYEALSALAEEVAASEATKTALLSAVPQGPEQDELIDELAGLAEDAGFDLNAVNFSLSTDNHSGDHLRVTANFTGLYDELIEFLQNLEGANRLMEVSSLSLQRTTTEDIVFNLTIQAYHQ